MINSPVPPCEWVTNVGLELEHAQLRSPEAMLSLRTVASHVNARPCCTCELSYPLCCNASKTKDLISFSSWEDTQPSLTEVYMELLGRRRLDRWGSIGSSEARLRNWVALGGRKEPQRSRMNITVELPSSLTNPNNIEDEPYGIAKPEVFWPMKCQYRMVWQTDSLVLF